MRNEKKKEEDEDKKLWKRKDMNDKIEVWRHVQRKEMRLFLGSGFWRLGSIYLNYSNESQTLKELFGTVII